MKRAIVIIIAAACTERTADNFTDPPVGPPPSCTAIAALDGCTGGSVAYACTSDRPDDGDTNLVCSVGAPGGGGTTLYCCAPYGTYFSDCAPDPTIAGCGSTSFGFACTGETGPADADAQLACDHGAPGGDGATHFCCTSATIPPTCAVDPSVACTDVAIGYTCVGTDAPNAGDPTRACVPTADPASYCCSPSM